MRRGPGGWRKPMKLSRLVAVVPLSLVLASPLAVLAEGSPDFAGLEAAQNAANSKPGVRTVPGRVIPVPQTASPQFQNSIAAAYRAPAWNANPKSAAEWKELIVRLAAPGAAAQPALREKMGVTMETATIGGVKAF